MLKKRHNLAKTLRQSFLQKLAVNSHLTLLSNWNIWNSITCKKFISLGILDYLDSPKISKLESVFVIYISFQSCNFNATCACVSIISVCETQYIQKTVTESKPNCTTSDMTMEMDGLTVSVPVKVE